jgi:23S rRNA (adenine-N6)-dimethyltransferase
VDARARIARAGRDRPSGQHFLRSGPLAAELVSQAGVGGELVLEIGAGNGRLTAALAARGAEVLALELDPEFAGRLRRRFAGAAGVSVREGDALDVELPGRPFRAFGNLPFGQSTAILRRLLDDPGSPLERADLIVQLELGAKRARLLPSTQLALGWQPWWELQLVRRLPAACFEPPPSVDAALLSAVRRRPALVDLGQRRAYLSLLERAFAQAHAPLRRSLAQLLPARAWKRFARERGLDPSAGPRELQVFDWAALCAACAASRGAGAPPPRPGQRRASRPPGRARRRR